MRPQGSYAGLLSLLKTLLLSITAQRLQVSSMHQGTEALLKHENFPYNCSCDIYTTYGTKNEAHSNLTFMHLSSFA